MFTAIKAFLPDDNVNTLLAKNFSLRLHHCIFLGVVTQHLSSDIHLQEIYVFVEFLCISLQFHIRVFCTGKV